MPTKFIFASYIVRVYRLKKNRPSSLVGVVEESGLQEKRAFTNLNELWDILSSCRDIKNQRKGFGKEKIQGKGKKMAGEKHRKMIIRKAPEGLNIPWSLPLSHDRNLRSSFIYLTHHSKEKEDIHE